MLEKIYLEIRLNEMNELFLPICMMLLILYNSF